MQITVILCLWVLKGSYLHKSVNVILDSNAQNLMVSYSIRKYGGRPFQKLLRKKSVHKPNAIQNFQAKLSHYTWDFFFFIVYTELYANN